MKKTRAAEREQKRRFWQGHLEKWQASGCSQVEYCRRNDLRENQLSYWKKKIVPEKNPCLVELPIGQFVSAAPRSPLSPIYVVIDQTYRIEVHKGFDADTLAQVVEVLHRT